MNQHNPCPAGNRSGAPTDTKDFSLMLPIARAQMGGHQESSGNLGELDLSCTLVGLLGPREKCPEHPCMGQ